MKLGLHLIFLSEWLDYIDADQKGSHTSHPSYVHSEIALFQ